MKVQALIQTTYKDFSQDTKSPFTINLENMCLIVTTEKDRKYILTETNDGSIRITHFDQTPILFDYEPINKHFTTPPTIQRIQLH